MTGAHEVTGPIYKHWENMGLERSKFGYPTSGVETSDGEQSVKFEYGVIRWTAEKGIMEEYFPPSNPIKEDKNPDLMSLEPDLSVVTSTVSDKMDLTMATAPIKSAVTIKNLAQLAANEGKMADGNDMGMEPDLANSILAEANRLEAEAKTIEKPFPSPAQLQALYLGDTYLAAKLQPETIDVSPGSQQVQVDIDKIWPMPGDGDVSGSSTSKGRQGTAAMTGVVTQTDAYNHLDPQAVYRATPVGVMESAFIIPKVAIALSGGGSKGDFQVGALRFIYDRLLGLDSLGLPARPDIITGTSVGAVNGSKLSEGYDDSLDQLEALWSQLLRNQDMYEPELDLNQLLQPLTESLRNAAIWSIVNVVALTGPLIGIGLAASFQRISQNVMDLLATLRRTRSLYNLNPISRRTRQYSPFWSLTGPGLRGAAMAAGHDQSGRLVIAARGYNDGCYVCVRTSVAEDTTPRFSRWIFLGRRIDSDPEFMLDAQGAIIGIVARKPDDARYHVIYLNGDASHRESWSASWEAMGFPEVINFEALRTGGEHVRFASSPKTAVGTGTLAGYKWVFARGNDNYPYSKMFTPYIVSPGGRWTVFQIMGGPVPLASDITFGRSSDDFKFAFARRTDNCVVVCLGGPSVPTWARWFEFAGEARGNVTTANYPDGRLVVFVVGMDYAVWCRSQTPLLGNSWESWQRLGGTVTSNVAAAWGLDGILTIFARGLDKAIWYKRADGENGFSASDYGWESLGSPTGVEFNTDPVVHKLPNSTLAVFAVGNDKKLYINAQSIINGSATFTGWHKIGGNLWTGIELRLATVSVESGDLRHVDESGRFCEALETPPGVPDGIIASASIPTIFPAVPINGQAWVDGGVRSVIPIQAAISAGAQLVYAISCSPNTLIDPDHEAHSIVGALQNAAREVFLPTDSWSFSETVERWSEASLADIGFRALDMLPHSILQLELNPYQPWPVPVYVIQPSFNLHDALYIDQGFIRIAEDYGWMRAYEATILIDPIPAMQSSDAIIRKRREIYLQEKDFFHHLSRAAHPDWLSPSDPARDSDVWSDANAAVNSYLPRIRSLKRELRGLVQDRMAHNFEMPSGADRWWLDWETPLRNGVTGGWYDGGGPFDRWSIPAPSGNRIVGEAESTA
jgi:predicted acylesterase/phospholipase RssA